MNSIPIPRIGIMWPVVNQLPPQIDGDIYYLYSNSDEYENEIAMFSSEIQALISVFLYGFSYQQLLILFPHYKSIQNIRNKIFPLTLTGTQDLHEALQKTPPRQLVDCEYVLIYRVTGKPTGKIAPLVYKMYMDWVLNVKPAFWLKKSKSVDELIQMRKKKEAKMHKLQDEINSINVMITESLAGGD